MDSHFRTSSRWPFRKYPFPPNTVQSPTDVETAKAVAVHLNPIVMKGFSETTEDCDVTIENTGYYLEILPKEGVLMSKPTLSGGPLYPDTYVFEQAHVHWGEDDCCGGEHRLNSECHSTEVHVVFYNNKYDCYKNAIEHYDGVAVAAFFGQVSDNPTTEKDNPDFNELMSKIPKIVTAGSETTGKFSNEFHFLFKLFEQTFYYAFPGSLTTPDYNQCVTWMLYPDTFHISRNQIDMFRSLKDKDGTGMITHNDRELQDFGNRPLVTPIQNKKYE